MESSVINRKSRVVIPAKMSRQLGLKEGTRVNFYKQNEEILMVPITAETIDKNIGILGLKGKRLHFLMEAKKKERQF